MADFENDNNSSNQAEASNNFDHDFEQLDPYAATPTHDDVVTSSVMGTEEPDEDLYSGVGTSSEAEAKLVSFGDEPSPLGLGPDSTQSKKEGISSKESWFQNVDPRDAALLPSFLDLIYWRDPKKSGIVFGSTFLLLLSLALFSVLSVVAYLSLATLTVTVSFRVYKNVLQAVQKTGDGHPFKEYLDVDLTVSQEKVHDVADTIVKRCECTIVQLRRLFLVEDLIDSVKFGLFLWVMTYIGAWFNGMTLVILCVVGIFTIPKFYETYKAQIDQYVDIARTQVKNVMKQVHEKLPFPGKKAKTQ